MSRIQIGSATDDPRTLGKPLMTDHNLSARLWATAAILTVPIASRTGLGWWLPIHLAMLGAASQAIVGGQLMFTTTLGLSPGPRRSKSLTQLGLLNLGAALVVLGRLESWPEVVAVGAAIFAVTIGWVTWDVHIYWRRSINRRFSLTGTFYRLAGLSIIQGATIGGALAVSAFQSAESYLSHRALHMVLNVLGWAGLTIVGTAITLLPTIVHVRAPKLNTVRPVPWLMFGGLMVTSTGASVGSPALGAIGLLVYLIGIAAFGVYLGKMLKIPRRRTIPTAARHLMAAVAWAALTAPGLVFAFIVQDQVLIRDLLVVGGVAGFVFQALLGAWSFLVPSTRPPDPKQRRVELTAMELGGKAQLIAFNLGLVLVLVGLHSPLDTSAAGITLTWVAAAGAMTKLWTFPRLASLPRVRALSERWWAPPES